MKTSSTLFKAPKFLVTVGLVSAAVSGLVVIAASYAEANNVGACTSRFGIVHGTPAEVASLGAGIQKGNDFLWQRVEPKPGVWDWSWPDAFLAGAEQHGFEIMGILAYGNTNYAPFVDVAPPDDISKYYTYVTNTVTRYKGRVKYWAIWNEPDNPLYWRNASGAAYAAVLKNVYKIIKSIDPAATVVMGGLAGAHSFLRDMYAAGAKGSFDVAAYHIYEATPNFEASQEFRDIMAANGDASKPIWITETGKAGKPPDFPLDAQAQQVRDTFGAMLTVPGLAQRVFWYMARDSLADADGYGAYGLLFTDGARKPAADVYSQMARTCGPGIRPPAAPTDIRVVRSP